MATIMDSVLQLGLVQGRVRLDDYTPQWAELYRLEAERICPALGDLAIDVQHVGSTAIPGLKAKPILDIAVGIQQLDAALQCQAPLTTLGYEYAPWGGIEHDHVFGKGVARTHLVHVVEYNGAPWRNYLVFRNTLRDNPELVQQYEALKLELSQRFPTDRAAYTAAKAPFIHTIIATYAGGPSVDLR